MKTLVLFGSPRQNGHTKQMLNIFLQHLGGEYKIIDAYKYFHSDKQIKPCVDCRYCWNHNACSINDSMSEVYSYLEQCNNVVIATPIYFNGIPAPLKIIIDRFQVYWVGTIRGDKPTSCNKKAVILMSGGSRPFESQFDCASIILRRVIKDINSKLISEVIFPDTDRSRLEDCQDVYDKIIEAAEKMG